MILGGWSKCTKKASVMCALQQKNEGQNVKTIQTVDTLLKVEYNCYENSLRIVCSLCEAAYSVRGIFVYAPVLRGQERLFYPFLNQIL